MSGSWANLFSFSTRGAQVGADKSEAEDFPEAVLKAGLPLAGHLGGRLSNREVNAMPRAWRELGLGRSGPWAEGPGSRDYRGSCARGAGISGFWCAGPVGRDGTLWEERPGLSPSAALV